MEIGEFPNYRSRRPQKRQEVLNLFFEPVIPREYSLERAQAAALRRRKRRDTLALTARTRTFLSNVGNLWIPYSSGENTLVIKSLDGEIQRNRLYAEWRVEEKWADSGKSALKIRQMAAFAAASAEDSLIERVRKIRDRSRGSFVRLQQALIEPDLHFDRNSILGSDWARQELAKYVYNLDTFVAATPVKRQFTQEHWRRVIEKKTAWAMQYIDGLTDLNLLELYDEAMHSVWSRKLYWENTLDTYYQNKRARLQQPPEPVDVPWELYDNDPEILGLDVDEVYRPQTISLPYVPYVRIAWADEERSYSLYRLKFPL